MIDYSLMGSFNIRSSSNSMVSKLKKELFCSEKYFDWASL